jgi:hypothetical protein
LTAREIKRLTRSLRRAAARANHLELPPTITTIEALHRYLDANHDPSLNTAPATSIERRPVQ